MTTVIPRHMLPIDLHMPDSEIWAEELAARATEEFDELVALTQDIADPIDNVPPDTRTLVIAVLTEVLQASMNNTIMQGIAHGHLAESMNNAAYRMTERAFMFGYVAGVNNLTLSTSHLPNVDD